MTINFCKKIKILRLYNGVSGAKGVNDFPNDRISFFDTPRQKDKNLSIKEVKLTIFTKYSKN